MKPRRREVRALRRASPKRNTLEQYAPLPAANEDPQGDEAWRDAIAGSHDTDTGIVDAAGTYQGERYE